MMRSGHGALRLALAVVVLSALSGATWATQRVALVIGNHNYEHVGDLVNPKKDAADIGAALEHIGFAVTSLENTSNEDLRRGLLEFRKVALRSDIAVVFYAGHGIEVDKQNYLVPIDASLETDLAVDLEAVSLDLVTDSVVKAKRLGLVILDACRDNPFLNTMVKKDKTRSVGDRGLAEAHPRVKNLLVAYSAMHGTRAKDGEPGGNSPYAEALLEYLVEPELHVEEMFRKVRGQVYTMTGKKQYPVEYGGLVDTIYLASGVKIEDYNDDNDKKDPRIVSEPGTTFQDCDECPNMVVVPSGNFIRERYEVGISRPFAVSVSRVTFEEWGACLSGNGCGGWLKGIWRQGRSNSVLNVSWNDAKAYVDWLSGRTRKEYRLLSESEWEYAEQEASALGIRGMNSTLQEWVEDCWNSNLQKAPRDGSAWTSEDCSRRVLLGKGLFIEFFSDRHGKPAGERNAHYGFRIARTLP